jgi:hypothetical protein
MEVPLGDLPLIVITAGKRWETPPANRLDLAE